jgi:sigma-E factor negative regulatory protein RseA
MKARISALMDGELERREAAGPLAALCAEGEARDAWRSFHVIGDAMRDTGTLSAGFAARVAARLAQEPTVVVPARLRVERPRAALWTLAAAASLAVVFVSGTVYMMQQDSEGPRGIAAVQPPQAPVKEIAQVPPPETANDYLYAHQGYSPRISLQGVAPYVRTVSGEAVVRKR